MSFATMAAPDSTVMELTSQHLDRLQGRLSNSAAVWFWRLAYRFTELGFARALNKTATELADDAIWFQGLSREVLHANPDLREGMVEMVGRLDDIKAALLSTRERMHRMHRKHESQTMCAARASVQGSAAALFEAMEDFRWALLELEANHSGRANGFYADTPEGVAEMFKRLKQPA